MSATNKVAVVTNKVAVVTGSNKGIGYAIVRGLCKRFEGDVYLTARNEKLGKEAVEKLKGEGLQPKFHQLDISDKSSIEGLKDFLEKNYGGLDILVNNAAIAFKVAATEPFAVQAEESVRVNYWGTLNVCNALFPLLRPHARVVHVSSRASNYAAKKSSEGLQKRFTAKGLTIDNVNQFMTEFVESAKDGSAKTKGWADSCYGTSKIGVTLLGFVQQQELNKDPREDIVVNTCCPGYVKTDMSSQKGTKSIDEGADTPLYLALLPENCKEPRGNFVCEKAITQWP